jgi:hypothetical protein
MLLKFFLLKGTGSRDYLMRQNLTGRILEVNLTKQRSFCGMIASAGDNCRDNPLYSNISKDLSHLSL